MFSHLWVGIFGKDVKKSRLSALSVAHHHNLAPQGSLAALHLAPRTAGRVRARCSFSSARSQVGEAAPGVCFPLRCCECNKGAEEEQVFPIPDKSKVERSRSRLCRAADAIKSALVKAASQPSLPVSGRLFQNKLTKVPRVRGVGYQSGAESGVKQPHECLGQPESDSVVSNPAKYVILYV